MAESLDDYFSKVYENASEENKGLLTQKESSFLDEVKYGFARSTYAAGDIDRLLESYSGDRSIEDIEAERLKRIEDRFYYLPQESKESYTALGSELASELLDPSLIAGGYLAIPAKATKLGKLAQRAYTAGGVGGLTAADAAIDETARGGDVTLLNTGTAALLGTVLGGFVKPKVLDEVSGVLTPKQPKTASKVEEQQPSTALDNEETAIKETLAEVDASNPGLISAVSDIPNMGAKISQATAVRKRYHEERGKFKAKQPGALSKKQLDDLKVQRDEARLFMRSLPKLMQENAETLSDALIETTDRLAANGMLKSTTIRRALTRPLIGAGIGYGAGVTNQLISEDDTVSPFAFMLLGLVGGQLSKKILKTDYSTSVKEEGLKSLQDLNKNVVRAQLNLLGSGTTAARLNSLGPDVSAFGKTLLSQRGADLKGAASVSVEEAKDLSIQELHNVFNTRMMDLGALGDDAKALREAAWKYSEKFIDEEGLASQGFSKGEIAAIKEISAASRQIVDIVSAEAENVGIDFVKLKDYVLPQMHDTRKIAENRELAIDAYSKAYAKQLVADTRAKKLAADPSADVSNIFLNENQLAGIRSESISYIDELINLGYSGKKINTWKSEGVKDSSDLKLRLNPLSAHFEQDRVFKDFEAREAIQDFLVQDVSEIIPEYVNKSMPNIEFSRAFGPRGEAIDQLKRSIQKEAEEAKKAAGADGELYKLAENVRATKIKNIHNAVEMYFGTYGADVSRATSSVGTSILSVMTMLGNMSFLTKVTLDSVGDLVQPFKNSGFAASLRGQERTNSKELTDFAESTGFAKRDVLSQELRALALDRNNAGSKTQSFTAKNTELFFRFIQLGRLTSYARRFAYNTGIEDAFNIAQEAAKKGMTQTVFNKAKALGLTDEYIKTLQKFKNVDEAFDDVDGKRILNIAGVKTADRDALIPQVGNRLGFSQTKDPLIRTLGQFLSWAQAKTTQTNALVQRVEDGDAALAIRGLGSLVVYDGLVTLKQYLNDPTGKYLDEDQDSYLDKLVTREQLGASIMQSGVSPFYLNKMVSIAARPYGSTVFSNLAPSAALIEDYFKLGTAISKNIEQEDYEGMGLQFLRRVPFGKEVEDVLAVTGYELEDSGDKGKKDPKGRLPIIGFSKGGEVLDVPNVPKEPDERIDKMTGIPYDQQAGTAFVDEEDPLRRLGFKGGGEVDPLKRLGFGLGSIVKAVSKFGGAADDVSDQAFKKDFDELTEAINKGETPKMFKEAAKEGVEENVDDTIRPYESVPRPATYEEMNMALDARKKEKINVAIPEGQKVGLRLDIPAYTRHDVWVPTIHDEGGTKLTSHRATAAIKDVDLFMSEANQIKGEKIKKRQKPKSPFARIGGKLINRSDEENYALAQKYLNDPEWTQVGYNPDKHSYFFDRATGEPVIGGDEAIQVGPLVLVKNAVKGDRKDFRYAEGGKVLKSLARRGYAGGGLYSSVSNFMEEGAAKVFGIDGEVLRKHEAQTMALVNRLVDAGSLPEHERVKVEKGRMLSGDVFNAANHMRLARVAGDSTVKRALLQGKEYVQQAAGDTGPHGAEGDRRNNSIGFDLYDKAGGNVKKFEKLVEKTLVDKFGSQQKDGK